MGPEILAASSKLTTSPETNGSDVTIEAIGASVETDHEVAFSYTTQRDVSCCLVVTVLRWLIISPISYGGVGCPRIGWCQVAPGEGGLPCGIRIWGGGLCRGVALGGWAVY